ncbi:MAG: carboxymuconolactone decarboxylase family protein [Armatimonadetes bacterium]|nr:carboxymuconolactone decarboxylase family protein [Armatimonadota bacterium]
MEKRLNYSTIAPSWAMDMAALGRSVQEGIDGSLLYLVDIRASQINRCSFCLDMHSKEAKIAGERELKLYHIAAWPESNLFSERERAALALTEHLTLHPDQGVSDDLYNASRQHFSEKEFVALVYGIGLINAWNRLNAVFRTTPGAYDKMFGLDQAGLS